MVLRVQDNQKILSVLLFSQKQKALLSFLIAHFRVFALLKTGPEFGRESEVRLGGAKIKRDRWFFYP